MGLFNNLTTEGLEETEDRLGGGRQVLDTDIYNGTIKMAYWGKSSGGAEAITVLVALENGKEYRETIYYTDKSGKNFYMAKDKDQKETGKKAALPGFITIDEICICASEKPLAEQATEEKLVKIYNFEEKKEIPTSVPVLVDLIDQPITLAIQKKLENKNKKNDQTGKYEPTADTQEINQIVKAFNTPTKLTAVEARKGQPAEFHDAWKEKNKGETYDARSIKDGEAGKSGRPGSSTPPTSSGGGERKSLFGKKD